MSFLMMPPELNSILMYTGAGSAPMLQAASAWDGLASELGTAASSFSSVTAGLSSQAWQGAASQAMAAAAAPYAGWLSAASAHAAGAAQQARSVADVFEAAQAAVVHPLAVEANRNGFVRLVMSNFFGQNAPAIAAAESVYEEMWAKDVDAMVGYHAGASQAAAALTPLEGVVAARRDPFGALGKFFVRLVRDAVKEGAKEADKARIAAEQARQAAQKTGAQVQKVETDLIRGQFRQAIRDFIPLIPSVNPLPPIPINPIRR